MLLDELRPSCMELEFWNKFLTETHVFQSEGNGLRHFEARPGSSFASFLSPFFFLRSKSEYVTGNV